MTYIQRSICVVHAGADDLPIMDKDATDRDLLRGEGELSLRQGTSVSSSAAQ